MGRAKCEEGEEKEWFLIRHNMTEHIHCIQLRLQKEEKKKTHQNTNSDICLKIWHATYVIYDVNAKNAINITQCILYFIVCQYLVSQEFN